MLTQIFSVFETSCKWYMSGVSIVAYSLYSCRSFLPSSAAFTEMYARTFLGLAAGTCVARRVWLVHFLLFPFSPTVRYSEDNRPL